MNNKIGLLFSLLLLVTLYACKSDQVSSTVSNEKVEAQELGKAKASNNTESKTAEKSSSKAASNPSAGKKGNMKGGMPAKTFAIKDGMVNTIKAGMIIAFQREILLPGYIGKGSDKMKVDRLLGDKGGPIGYVIPRLGNTDLVGDIILTSSKAKTEHGMRIGNTFSDLQEATSKIEFHGSRSEGKTYARVDNISYKLDGIDYSDGLDASQIKSDTKIIEILIADKKPNSVD